MRPMGAIVLILILQTPSAWSEPIFEAGAFPGLDEEMERHGRQYYLLTALPFGLSLDAHPANLDARTLIEQFLAQDASDDVQAVTGSHTFELMASYGEFGDLGFFGGVALAGTVYEYLTLKRDGAPASAIERARARVVRAAESWHVFYQVTGGNGLVARGIRRLVPEDPDSPPLPGSLPEVIDLFDHNGDPLPMPKNNGAFRWDNSGGSLPEGEWIWVDSCSKDQMVGQVFGMVALYDAMNGDPDIDQALVERLRNDAKRVGQMLMEKRDIASLPAPNGNPMGEGLYDLIIMDADGRPTFYHDLNPKSLESFYFANDSSTFNRFNVVMALGVIKGLHHVSGDPALEAYLYDELMDERGFLDLLFSSEGAIDYIYMNKGTNWDNPDMTAVSLWLALYTETDAQVRAELHRFLEDSWWAPEDEPTYSASMAKQPLWHAIHMTLTDRGVDPAKVAMTADLLEGFELGPYFNDERINCDEAEITARQCIAIDGTTVLNLVGEGERGGWMADEALHPSIRPPSNFDSRSNPFAVNGGGGMRLNPGGDLLASYWIGRYMQAKPVGQANVSPNARQHMPIGGWPADGGTDGGSDPDDGGGGCGCATSAVSASRFGVLLLLLLLTRRRSSF